MRRNGVATFRCRLSDEKDGKAYDVPQWMFDPAACARIKKSDQPYVSVLALRQLVQLLSDANASGRSRQNSLGELKNEHFQDCKGDALDENARITNGEQTTRSVRASTNRSKLEPASTKRKKGGSK